MKWRGRIILSALGLLGVALFMLSRSPVSFSHLDEARGRIQAAGYHCTTDSVNKKVGQGFLVSREAVSRDEICDLIKVGKMGPEWKGRVWVTVNSDRYTLQTVLDDAGTRQWGRIVVFGDRAFLEELEGKLQGSRFRVL